jgi:protein-S-isoprenylcysteine O-methyltransferase Ste14
VKRSALILIVVPIWLIVWIGITLARPPWNTLRIAGAVIAVFGFAFLTLARLQLGNAFSIRPQATTLVTHGLYSRIRNPVYVFGAVGIAGLILYIQRPWLLLLFVVLVPLQIARARAESSVLEARFGDEYRKWRQQTWL